MNEEASELYGALKSDKERLIKKYYLKYMGECIAYAQKQFGCTKEIAKKIYQDAFSATYENVRAGKLKGFNKAPIAYLKTVCNYKLQKHRKENGRYIYDDKVHLLDGLLTANTEEGKSIFLQRITSLKKALKALGEPCKGVLIARIVHKYSREEIAKEYNYKNEETVGTAIYRCKERLSKLFFDLENNNTHE